MSNFLDSNGLSYLWSKLKSLLNGKANTQHTHNTSDVNGLEDSMEVLALEILNKADKVHTHEINDVTNLSEITKNILPYSWDPISTSAINNIQKFAYGNNLFVGVGNLGVIMYSTDGKEWTEVSNSPFTRTIYDITYGNGRFIAVATHGEAGYSIDGKQWILSNDLGITSSNIKSIAYGNGVFITCHRGSSHIWYTTDGVSWTESSTGIVGNIQDITFGDDKFVVISSYGSVEYCTSNPPTTWTMASINTTSEDDLTTVTYGDSGFVLGGANGTLASSQDGTSWTVVRDTGIESTSLRSIVYGNHKYLIFALDLYCITQRSGISSPTKIGENDFYNMNGCYGTSLSYCKDRFMLGGPDSYISYSIC